MMGIRAAWLFDGIGPELIKDPVVLIENGKIVSVGSDPVPDLVDLGDVTLLPGLIDTHTHLAFNATDDAVGHFDGLPDETLLEEMLRAARTTLRSGVTTIRDLGDRNYLSLWVRHETVTHAQAGPMILASGPPITPTGGHCWFLGGEADGIDGVRAAVRERFERGVDVVKVMASGGGLTEGSRMYDRQYGLAELRVMAEEAHRLGLPIAAHAHGVASIGDLVEAGFDTIEHCSFMTEDGIHPDDELISRMAASDVVVSLTVGMVPGGPPLPEAMLRQIAQFVDLLHAMRDAGVRMMCGSDNGILAIKPHDSYGYSVAAMIEMAGLSPLDALRSATSEAAKVCRVADRKGVIAPGMDADLVAVAGDPLSDIAALRSVTAVFRGGERIAGV